MKNRGSLLKALTHFDRCLKARSTLIKNESMWTLNSGNAHELAQTARQIERVQLAMKKLSRELVERPASAPRLRLLTSKMGLLSCASGKTHQRFGLRTSTVVLKPGRKRRVLPPC